MCPCSLQFQHTGPALSAHGQFGDTHYQSITGLVLRTNTVLVWKVLLAACCQGLLLRDGEHWPQQLSLRFATPMSGRAVPRGVNVAVSVPSPQLVATE